MRLTQSNKLNMYSAVSGFLHTFNTIVNSIVKFAETLAKFDVKVTAILASESVKQTAKDGKTEVKTNAEEELIDTIMDVTASVYNYATETANAELKALANVNYSGLEKMKDVDLGNKAQQVYDAVQPISAGLSDYGLGETDLATLLEKKEAFTASINARGASEGIKSGAGDSVVNLIKEADGLLEQMDNYVNKFITKNPEFYTG